MDAVVYHERGVGVSEKLLQSVSDVEQSALIDLWEIDLRPLGGELMRFCNLVNEKANR